MATSIETNYTQINTTHKEAIGKDSIGSELNVDNTSSKNTVEGDSYTHWRTEWSDGICPYCQKQYKGAVGVRVHISNSHPQQSQEIKISCRERKALSKKETKSIQTTSTAVRSQVNPPSVASVSTVVLPSLDRWTSIFSDLLSRNSDDDITNEFEIAISDFTEFLQQSLQELKGPQHPSTKFYRRRQLGQKDRRHTKYLHSTNPERSRKKRHAKCYKQYQYELAQFRYYNVRKQVVKSILNPNCKGSCKIPMEYLENSFRDSLETPNNAMRKGYESDGDSVPDSAVESFSVQEVKDAMKGMSVDTSPGPDSVFMRVVKTLKCESVIALIVTLMYQRSFVPSSFRSGKMVLVPKDGDPNQLNNWRPITIFSILRRIIERVLDRRLRKVVQFSPAQRGFVNVPGAHVNASIINGVLRNAKTKKDDCVVVFLDVSKAFDNVGHQHLRQTLNSIKIPPKLRELICKLFEDNTVQIHVDGKKSKSIRVLRGVPQGGPLSPSLFNLSINFLLNELSEESTARNYGYTLLESLAVVVALAFADDIALVAKNRAAAISLVELAVRGLKLIGLDVNMAKSKAIVIEKGKIVHTPGGLLLLNGESISTLGPSERVRYLGVDFKDQIILDEEGVLRDLKTKLDLLTNSVLLHPDQKLNVINQFIWPTLVYPLQTAPLHRIKSGFLNDIDCLIRSSVKQICKIPMDTPDSMIYSARKYRGLGVFKASWEAFLQHMNIVARLEMVDDPALQFSRDLHQEVEDCLRKLKITNEDHPPSVSSGTDSPVGEERLLHVRALRKKLRDKEFQHWCSLPSKGRGVETFKEYPPANKWISERCGLSYSEWTNALKMNTNSCNLRSNPRTASSTLRCRHCNEYETLAHVLGACPRGELLRNERHNRVCDTLAADLREAGFEVSQEVHLVTKDGSRFADLVAIKTDSTQSTGFILDPTIRFETSTAQAEEVNEEKKTIYDPALACLKTRHPGISNWQVIGLLFGARGTLSHFTTEVLTREFGIKRAILTNIAMTVLKDSLGILNHHIYTRGAGI